ncbi:ABC transporter permease family protein [Caldicoprobacter faecalis]|uniref:Putative aldouronate transport system permease protein n=1 Tax=Caldicoprobacter faecalis TaxID=937334 RepID=A0A1I5YIV8_9FIRM|nr:hypothetical protein [Caldicoprobacter faecalis]SFQ44154.1 putative aldouronate transport system permease protein [Caldicoprobacter faecalis]
MILRRKRNQLGNELTFSQKVVNSIFLALVFIMMFLPMWNVIVVSTSTALGASRAGVILWWSKFSLEGYKYVFGILKLGRAFFNSVSQTSQLNIDC